MAYGYTWCNENGLEIQETEADMRKALACWRDAVEDEIANGNVIVSLGEPRLDWGVFSKKGALVIRDGKVIEDTQDSDSRGKGGAR